MYLLKLVGQLLIDGKNNVDILYNLWYNIIMTTKLNYRYDLPKEIDWGSVTEICGCAMKWGLVYFYGKWGIKKAKEIANEASGIGKAVHSYINQIFQGNKRIIVDADLKKIGKSIANFEVFRKQHILEPRFLEQVVYSEKYKYVGTLDYFGWMDGELVLLDWKTSKDIYFDYKLQVQAYWTALEEMLQKKLIQLPKYDVKDLPVKLKIIRFDKVKDFNPKKDILTFKPNEEIKRGFLGLLDYYNCSKNQK